MGGAYPQPLFYWLGPRAGNLTVEEAGGDEYDGKEHQYLSHSSVLYTPSVNDTNTTISCGTEQHDTEGVLLYKHLGIIHLDVKPLPLPKAQAISAKVGIISGILLTIIFILLVCVIATALVYHKKRTEQVH